MKRDLWDKRPVESSRHQVYITLREPDESCLPDEYRVHTDGWLYMQFKATDGSLNHSLVPPWRVVKIGWSSK